jgi:hypothetical protein
VADMRRENELLREAVAAMKAKGKTYPPLHMALRIAELEEALRQIAEAEVVLTGDIINVARKALDG